MKISTYLNTSLLIVFSLTACTSNLSTNKINTSPNVNHSGYPVAGVIKKVLINGTEYSYKAVNSNDEIQADLSRTFVQSPIDISSPITDMFDGKTAITADVVAITANKTNINYNEQIHFFKPETLHLLGFKEGVKPNYKNIYTVTQHFSVPDFVQTGNSGLLLQGKTSSWSEATGSFVYHWSLKKVNSATANLCLVKTYNNDKRSISNIDTHCFLINKAGDILNQEASHLTSAYDGSAMIKYITQ